MSRRRTLARSLVVGLLALVAVPVVVGALPSLQDAGSGRVQHVVIVWLKEPGDADARRRLLEASRELAEIPGVESVSAGEPLSSERPVVDDSFDVAMVLTFESAAALRAYQVHPDHVRAVEQVLQPLTERLLVYDFVE